MKPFFQVQTLSQVQAYAEAIKPLPSEPVALLPAAGRTLAADLAAPHDLPGFARATMDGYALRGQDTFGASETSPGYLALAGEVVMGRPPAFGLGPGQCARIGTGGMLPKGADAVVMVEHTRLLGEATVEVSKSVAPGANTLGPCDDAAKGQVLLPAGHRLRPQDVGLLAALGISQAQAVQRPRVGIISTGDEVVPVEADCGPGQVRDVNTYTLASQVCQAGGEPEVVGLVPDQEDALRSAVARSLERCELTLLSGGSSMGARDLTVGVFMSFPGAELLVHGVAVSPGKPFIWVRAGRKQLLGLPGQVASCLITFHLFVEPILERLLGRPARSFTRFSRLAARLTRSLPSVSGREEFVRVKVARSADGFRAEPLFGKSGLLSTLVQGQGLVRVPLNSEGLDAGASVEVLLFP